MRKHHTSLQKGQPTIGVSCKLLEYIIVSNLPDHLDLYNILVDCQHGFQSRSCEIQLVTFVNEILENMEKGTQTDV